MDGGYEAIHHELRFGATLTLELFIKQFANESFTSLCLRVLQCVTLSWPPSTQCPWKNVAQNHQCADSVNKDIVHELDRRPIGEQR